MRLTENKKRGVVLAAVAWLLASAMLLAGEDRSASTSKAPDFRLRDQSNRSVALRDYRGWVVLLDFWASWCGPCRKTMPRIQKWHEDYEFEGLKVIGVNIEGKNDKSMRFLKGNPYTFTVLFDEGNFKSRIARQYGVNGIPRTFLIDRYGVIRYAGHPTRLTDDLIRRVLRH